MSLNISAKEYCQKNGTDVSMSYSAARAIALDSECVKAGDLLKKHWCNEGTGTWWIKLHPHKSNSICNPACVIDVVEKTASVNWMCTGVLK